MAKKFINIGRTAANQDSGNHCIGVDQICESDDYRFLFEDGSAVIISNSKVMNYIANHQDHWKYGCWIKDDFGNKVRFVRIGYFLIDDEYIRSCA